MDDYQRLERAERDLRAAEHDTWYRSSKGLLDGVEQRLFAETVGDAGIILDIGCGTGRVARSMTAPTVVGVDISLASLAQAPAPVTCASVVEGLPIRSGAVDVVTACQVLQHLMPQDLGTALAECARVLRPGGRLVVSGYNLGSFRYRGSPPEITFDNGIYAHRMTATTFEGLLASNGFVPSSRRHYRTLPLHRLRHSSWNAIDRAIGRSPVGRRVGDYFLVVATRSR